MEEAKWCLNFFFSRIFSTALSHSRSSLAVSHPRLLALFSFCTSLHKCLSKSRPISASQFLSISVCLENERWEAAGFNGGKERVTVWQEGEEKRVKKEAVRKIRGRRQEEEEKRWTTERWQRNGWCYRGRFWAHRNMNLSYVNDMAPS